MEKTKQQPYVVLKKEGAMEVRLYSPQQRTLFNVGKYHNVQFPHTVFAFLPNKKEEGKETGGYLYAGFALGDLTEVDDLESASIYRMPFPAHFDISMFGPCCLDWSQNYHQPGSGLDQAISKFWQSEFRGVGDYGQGFTVEKWEDLTLGGFYQVLQKSPKHYKSTFAKFWSQMQEDLVKYAKP